MPSCRTRFARCALHAWSAWHMAGLLCPYPLYSSVLPYMVGLARCVLHVWLATHVCAPPYKDGSTHLLLSMYVGHGLQCKVGSAWPSMHGHLGTSCPADMASLAHPCPSMHGWLGTAQSVLIFELGGVGSVGILLMPVSCLGRCVPPPLSWCPLSRRKVIKNPKFWSKVRVQIQQDLLLFRRSFKI